MEIRLNCIIVCRKQTTKNKLRKNESKQDAEDKQAYNEREQNTEVGMFLPRKAGTGFLRRQGLRRLRVGAFFLLVGLDGGMNEGDVLKGRML